MLRRFLRDANRKRHFRAGGPSFQQKGNRITQLLDPRLREDDWLGEKATGVPHTNSLPLNGPIEMAMQEIKRSLFIDRMGTIEPFDLATFG